MSQEPEQENSGQVQTSPENATLPAKGAAMGALLRKWVRILLWMIAVGLVLVVALLSAVARYVESAEFHERVRQFAVAQMERATGGRVELQRVEWRLAGLQFELYGMTVHGKEAASEAPLLRVEQVRGRLKWTPLLHGRLSFHELSVLRPLAHVEVYKDGSTNLPEPKLPAGTRADATARLLRLAMDHAALIGGLLQWKDEKIKLDGAADDVSLELGYRAADHSYEGAAKVGQVRMQLPGWEPLTVGAEARFRLYQDRVEVPRLRVSSGRSWVEANGAVTGMSSPVAQFAYRAVGDLGELARLVHYQELRGGAVQSDWGRNVSLGSGRICRGWAGAGGRRELGEPDLPAGEDQRRHRLFAGP